MNETGKMCLQAMLGMQSGYGDDFIHSVSLPSCILLWQCATRTPQNACLVYVAAGWHCTKTDLLQVPTQAAAV